MARIEVKDEDGLRLLQFGTEWTQGAMRVDAPNELILPYARLMVAWLLFHDVSAVSGLHLATIGLGAGSLARLSHDVLGQRTTAAEVDADVIDVCRTHFGLPPEGDRFSVVQADGAAFVAQAPPASIDVLQVDAYDASVERPALDSDEFYAACRASLRHGGTLVTNLIGRDLDVRASVARIREHLRPTAIWQFPPTDAGNVVVVAPTGEVPAEKVLVERAASIAAQWGLAASQWLAMARRSRGAA